MLHRQSSSSRPYALHVVKHRPTDQLACQLQHQHTVPIELLTFNQSTMLLHCCPQLAAAGCCQASPPVAAAQHSAPSRLTATQTQLHQLYSLHIYKLFICCFCSQREQTSSVLRAAAMVLMMALADGMSRWCSLQQFVCCSGRRLRARACTKTSTQATRSVCALASGCCSR